MATKKNYIIPGYGATPSDHWFPWLAEKINKQAHQTATILQMPNPEQPKITKWLQQLESQIPLLDTDTYFVAHSLGCIATLNYLNRRFQQNTHVRIGGLLLISGFFEKLSSLPELDLFITSSFDFSFKTIKQITQGNMIVLSSANDSIVPTEQTNQLALALNADYYRKRENGHFLAEDGYSEFPLAWKLLQYLEKI